MFSSYLSPLLWSEAAAAVSAASTAADVVTTNADAAQVALDKIATNADVVLTNADVVLTNADVVLTNADVVLTNADVVLTNADAAQTALDRIATAADVVSVAASLSDLDYENGEFTWTTVGMSPEVSMKVYYLRIGNMVSLSWYDNLAGTSNSTSLALTGIPVGLRPPPGSNLRLPLITVDNGIYYHTGFIQIGSSSTWQVRRNTDFDAWTASGTKGIYVGGSLVYRIGDEV